VRTDVTDPANVTALFRRVRDEVGAIPILVNNAGIYPVELLLEISPGEGTFLCTTEAVVRMQASGNRGPADVADCRRAG